MSAHLLYRKGIFYHIIAVALFSVLNMCVKLLSHDMDVIQVSFLRGFVPLIFMVLFIFYKKDMTMVRTYRPFDHFLRAVIGVTSLYLMFVGFAHLPLADVSTYLFSAPLFTVALAAPLLKEKITSNRVIATLVGFGGILIVVNPTGGLNHYALYPLASAFFLSLTGILVRSLGSTESSFKVTFYYHLGVAVFGAVCLPFVWKPMGLKHIPIILLLGFSGGVAQFLLNKAFQLVQASALSPYFYLSIVWSSLLGFFVWGDVPKNNVFIGAAVVIMAGLWSHFVEEKKHKASAH